MSTIVAVYKNHKICIAADTLTTLGNTKLSASYERFHDKIYKYQDNFIGIVGSAAHHMVFEHLFNEKQKFRFHNRQAIFDSFLTIHSILKDKYFLNTEEDEDDDYESSRIDALIVNPYGIFGVYSLREVFEYTKFWAIGSGEEYSLGAMFALYDQTDSAQGIAQVGVQAGVEFDQSSGGPFTSYLLETKK